MWQCDEEWRNWAYKQGQDISGQLRTMLGWWFTETVKKHTPFSLDPKNLLLIIGEAQTESRGQVTKSIFCSRQACLKKERAWQSTLPGSLFHQTEQHLSLCLLWVTPMDTWLCLAQSSVTAGSHHQLPNSHGRVQDLLIRQVLDTSFNLVFKYLKFH